MELGKGSSKTPLEEFLCAENLVPYKARWEYHCTRDVNNSTTGVSVHGVLIYQLPGGSGVSAYGIPQTLRS